MLPANTATRADAPCLYILGLESTGTRFVSREIMRMRIKGNADPRRARLGVVLPWDGENPPCASVSGLHILHASLPWGGTCTSTMKTDVLNDNLKYGLHHPQCWVSNMHRWVLNVSSVLAQRKCHAIYLTRTNETRGAWTRAHRSRYDKHCRNEKRLGEEERLGTRLLQEALRDHPTLVLKVDYSDLQWSNETWQRIGAHAWTQALPDHIHRFKPGGDRPRATMTASGATSKERWCKSVQEKYQHETNPKLKARFNSLCAEHVRIGGLSDFAYRVAGSAVLN